VILKTKEGQNNDLNKWYKQYKMKKEPISMKGNEAYLNQQSYKKSAKGGF